MLREVQVMYKLNNLNLGYGRDGGMDAVSQLLNGVIRKHLKIDDTTLVSYCARPANAQKYAWPYGVVF